ncbi:hypothetical protein O3P69_007160 [Scylla paramamosain]|uniref:Uncharacterized protein n=1 Tax=Scylla paramamosain TaxID=85552 RepID=A0AAW0V1P6_SCYPA
MVVTVVAWRRGQKREASYHQRNQHATTTTTTTALPCSPHPFPRDSLAPITLLSTPITPPRTHSPTSTPPLHGREGGKGRASIRSSYGQRLQVPPPEREDFRQLEVEWGCQSVKAGGCAEARGRAGGRQAARVPGRRGSHGQCGVHGCDERKWNFSRRLFWQVAQGTEEGSDSRGGPPPYPGPLLLFQPAFLPPGLPTRSWPRPPFHVGSTRGR